MNFLELKEAILFKIRTNKIVRILVYPFINYRRISDKQKYKLTLDAMYIRTLKNTKKGKRCFIVGNGPSLTVEDLNKLKEEDTFAFKIGRAHV